MTTSFGQEQGGGRRAESNERFKVTGVVTEKALKDTLNALDRVQKLDANKLERGDELGLALSFADAVKPAQAVIDVYKRIPITALADLTETQLNTIKGEANADYQLYQEMLKFDPVKEIHPAQRRQELIEQVQARRDYAFQQLWQFIAYGVARLTDTSLLETQARATIQSINDEAKVLTDKLASDQRDAENVLKTIREVAVEQGVSQQAVYFKGEAQDQEDKARDWLKRTYRFAWILGGFAFIGLFLHRCEWLAPKSRIEALQFVTSKVLIYALLGFLLIMAARNYATHKHNAVVNRHRQNALLTYRALVAAAGEQGTEDIVLAHAAACIFAPQVTGYSSGQTEGTGSSKSVLELMTKAAAKAAD